MKAQILILLCTSTIGLISCTKNSDSDKIGDAQFCLDTATETTVQGCIDKVAGVETPGAYIIRCSANFIAKGFGNSQDIVDMFSNLSASGGSSLNFLAALNFGSTTEANEAFTNCSKTNQKGMTLLGGMAKSATAIASFGVIDTNDPLAIQAALSTILNGTPEQQAAASESVGTAVTAIYESSCQTGTPANEDLCAQMDQAYADAGTSDPSAVGLAILQAWGGQ